MKEPFHYLRLFLYALCILSLVNICLANVKIQKRADEERGDNGETLDDDRDASIEIATEGEATNVTCTRRLNSMMHEIRAASPGQFPFMAAIMSRQNEYLCAGTVVSTGLILTTAQCTQQPISYVLLNTIRDRKDETAVMLHIIKTDKFPTYVGSDSIKDVALVYTEKHNSSVAAKIKLSTYKNAQNVTDLEALGFGLNAEMGQMRELQYVGIEHRPFNVASDILPGYFDCVDTKVLTCFKDTGGPAIVNGELYGIVINGQYECTREMTSIYSINKRLVDILATYAFKTWLDERIAKNEDRALVGLMRYSEADSKNSLRAAPIVKLTSKECNLKPLSWLLPLILYLPFLLTI